MDHQGTTGNQPWANLPIKNQNALGTGNEVGQSVESRGAIAVIGADGNNDSRDSVISRGIARILITNEFDLS